MKNITKNKHLVFLLLFNLNCGQSEDHENPCIPEGNTFSIKDGVAKECCQSSKPKTALSFVPKNERNPKLQGLSTYKCKSENAIGVNICVNCGDNICSKYENPCTCPNDCPEY